MVETSICCGSVVGLKTSMPCTLLYSTMKKLPFACANSSSGHVPSGCVCRKMALVRLPVLLVVYVVQGLKEVQRPCLLQYQC